MKEYIYVLNYNDGKVYRIDVDEEDEDKIIERLLRDYGFEMDEVEFIWSTTKTDKIEIANKVR